MRKFQMFQRRGKTYLARTIMQICQTLLVLITVGISKPRPHHGGGPVRIVQDNEAAAVQDDCSNEHGLLVVVARMHRMLA